jgi:uncharacterized protein YprB with RNaseH-like and TPR domain
VAKPKVLLFDLETTNLAANFGVILCGAWKELSERKIHHVSVLDSPTFDKDPTNDRLVVKTMAEALSEADVIVGWYSQKFDFPFLQTRLLAHGMPPMPPIPHVDGWRIARYKMRLNSNRLASASAFLGVEEKTPLSGPIWIKAAAGNRRSIKYVIEHCRQDIVVLEQVYRRIRPLSVAHPNTNVINDLADGCPVCGAVGRLQKRGWSIARVSRHQRYCCRECGAWSRGKPERAKNVEVR